MLGSLLAVIGCGPRLLGHDGGNGGEAGETAATGEGTLSGADGAELPADTTTGELVPPVLELGFSQIKQFDFGWAPVPAATHYQLLERVTPEDEYVQLGGDIVEPGISVAMPLHLRLGASYVLRACDAVDCVESEPVEVVSSMAEAVGYFKASNTDAGDDFAKSIALSRDGSTLAVGAHFEDSGATGIDGDQSDDSAQAAGAVYVFVRNEADEWSPQAYIKASNTDASDFFGWSIALDGNGDTLAVGAIGESSDATGIDGDQSDESAPGAGAVYVFVRDASNEWSQQAYVKASNTDAGDAFGHSVSLSDDGDRLAIGSELEASSATGIDGDQSDDFASQAGAVYVLSRGDDDVWSHQAYLKASNTDVGHRFGSIVAMSSGGDVLAVGAPFESSGATGIDGDQSDESAPGAGAVYVFVRDDDRGWSQQAYVKASNAGTGDAFGTELALSGDGNTLAVGAPTEPSNAIGIDGDQADDSTPTAGAIYVYAREPEGTWSQQAYVKASNTHAWAWFGFKTALSADGSILAVGAMRERSTSTGIGGSQMIESRGPYIVGATYVFVRAANSTWMQRAYVKASNSGAQIEHGASVALSADGNILAVGGRGEDSSAVGIGGDQTDASAMGSGAVYLY